MFIRRIAIRTPRVTTHLERKRKRKQTGYVSSPKYSWWRMSYHRIRLQRWWSHYVPKCAGCVPRPQSTCSGVRLLWISEPNQPYISKNIVKVILVRGNACYRNWSKTPTDEVTFFSWCWSGFSQKHGICSREKKKWNEENLERCHSVIKKHKNSLMPWLPLLQSANAPLVHRKPRADDTSWSQ